MKNFIVWAHFYLFITGFSLTTHAVPLKIEKLDNCNAFAARVKNNTFSRENANAIDTVKKRYAFVKKFSVGKGGAYVAIVKDLEDGNKEKVIKIFPSVAITENKYNYRELYYSCINSFVSYKNLGINIDGATQLTRAFPQLFELGITSAESLDGPASSLVYPYMISELVKGESLTTLAARAKDNKGNAQYTQNLDYSLFNKLQVRDSSNSALLMNKRRTQFVTYAIAQILFQLRRLTIEGKEYGFQHNDLNAGNIMIRDKTFSGTMDVGYGVIKASHIPLITFIDFGHSTSNFDDNLGPQVKNLKSALRGTLHFQSGSLEEFYKNLNNSDLGTLSEAAIAATTTDVDIRFYRIIARSLFDSNNYVNIPLMKHLNSCTTRTECVQKAPKLFEEAK